MGCLLLLTAIVHAVAIFFFPYASSIVAGAGWILLWLLDLGAKREARSIAEELELSGEERDLLISYAFWIRMPRSVEAISSGSAAWVIVSVLWVVVLGFQGLWILMPLAVFSGFQSTMFTIFLSPIPRCQGEERERLREVMRKVYPDPFAP